jgi:signal recognition particle subunit SRP54
MSTMMKKMKKMGGLSKIAALFGKGGGDMDALMGGAGLPPGGLPGGLPGLPGGNPQGLPPGFQNFLKKR